MSEAVASNLLVVAPDFLTPLARFPALLQSGAAARIVHACATRSPNAGTVVAPGTALVLPRLRGQ